MKKIVSISILGLSAAIALAQPTITDNQDLVGSLKTGVILLDRVKLLPETTIGSSTTAPVTVSPTEGVRPNLMNLEYEAPSIRPTAMKKILPPPPFSGWLKLGVGYPLSPYVEGHYTKRLDKALVGAYIKHHSLYNTNIQHQQFSHSRVQLDGSYFFDTAATLSGKIGYDYNQPLLYAKKATDMVTYSREQATQRFQTLFGEVALRNGAITKTDFHWKGGLGFHTLNDYFGAQESNIGASVDVTKWLKKRHNIDVKINNSYNRFGQKNGVKEAANLLTVAPSFTYHTSKFRAKVGAFLGYDNAFTAIPDVELMYSPAQAIAVYGGWTGNVRQNTFRSLTNYNPYIVSDPVLRNSYTEDRYIGLKGKYGILSYTLQGGQMPITNMPLYQNDLTDYRRFAVIYDKTAVWYGQTVLGIIPSDDLEVSLQANYRKITTTNEKAAWHLPTFEGNLSGKYIIYKNEKKGQRAYTNLGLISLLGIPYFDSDTQTKKELKPIFDINIGGGYAVNQKFSVFLNANNLTNQTYQRWNLYPNLGINFMGGIILKFK